MGAVQKRTLAFDNGHQDTAPRSAKTAIPLCLKLLRRMEDAGFWPMNCC